jgi:hypothetical protein
MSNGIRTDAPLRFTTVIEISRVLLPTTRPSLELCMSGVDREALAEHPISNSAKIITAQKQTQHRFSDPLLYMTLLHHFLELFKLHRS